MEFLLYATYGLIVLIALITIFGGLSKIKLLSFLGKVASFIFGIAFIYIFLFVIAMYFNMIIAIIIVSYSLFKMLFEFVVIEDLATYFSLLLVLVMVAYFLEFLGSGILKLFEKFGSKNRYKMSIGFAMIVKILRPKLGIYILATVFTVIASIEKTIGYGLIGNTYWIDIKPFLFEAVVSFIALDAVISMLLSEKNGISTLKNNSRKMLLYYFDSMFQNNDKEEE